MEGRNASAVVVTFLACAILVSAVTANQLELGILDAPTHETPILNSSLATNQTTENLTAHAQNIVDVDGDAISLNFDWRINDTSIAILNMPFNLNISVNTTGAVRDYSTNTNNATLGAGNNTKIPTWISTGAVGGAYNFDGVDDYIVVGDLSALDNLEHMSICSWVNLGASQTGNYYPIVDRDSGTEGFSMQLGNPDTEALMGFGSSYGQTGSGVVDKESWNHWCYIYDGTQATNQERLKFYYNGQQKNLTFVGTIPSTTPTITANLTIGAMQAAGQPSERHLNATIDEVILLNKTLSEEQIQQLYKEGNASLNNASTNTSTLVSQETSVGDNWSVAVTPSDAVADGTARVSNVVTILQEGTPTSTVFDGATTDFQSESNLSSVQLTLEKSTYARIDWNNNVNVTNANYNQNVQYGNNWVFVNTSSLHPTHNSSANITLYGSWDIPVIYRNEEACQTCEVLAQNSTQITFNVTGFSNYSVENSTVNISFVAPTPNTDVTQPEGDVEINVSIQTPYLTEVIYNWNETNYTIYEDALHVLLNFDNRTALAENDTLIKDLSGKGNDATAYNSSTWIPQGRYGGAYSITDTSNGYIRIDQVNLSSTDAVTVAIWANRNYTSVGGHTLFEFTGNFNSYETGFGFFPDDAGTCSGGILVALRATGGQRNHGCYTQPSSNEWHHLVAVYDKSLPSDEVNLYIDGVLQTPFSRNRNDDSTNNFGNHPFYINTRGGNLEFNNATVDELRIYNRSLNASEIQQLYFTNLAKYDNTTWSLYVNQSQNATNQLETGDYTYQVFASSGNQTNQTQEQSVRILATTSISTCQELQNMSNDLAQNYVLANDIDCSDTINWNSGEGFIPIGDSITPFSGTLNGQNFSVTNLFINRPNTNQQALVGETNTGAEIQNIRIQNASIHGRVQVGALVGMNAGMVTNSSSSGVINATRWEVGGLVGRLDPGTVQESSSQATVYTYEAGDDWGWAGGLVGEMYDNATITDSYATGDVTGDQRVGGLIGRLLGGTINRTYSTGQVTVNMQGGGLIGFETGGIVENSFWDENTSNQTGSDGGEAKNTSEMKTITTYNDTATTGLTTAWDIVESSEVNQSNPSTWFIRDNNYPELRFQYTENEAPTHNNPILNSSLETNTTTENLTAYAQNLNDIDGDTIGLNFDWRLNGTSIAVLNMPFNTNISTNESGAVGDYSTYKNNATLGSPDSDQPTWSTSCVTGGCMYFNGSSEAIITHDASLEPDDFSVSFWVRRQGDQVSYAEVLMKGNWLGGGSNSYGFEFDLGGRRINFGIDTPGGSSSSQYLETSVLPDNQWVHIAGTYDSQTKNMSVYLNATLQESIVHDGVRRKTTQDISLGDYGDGESGTSGGGYYTGWLDELQIYNRTLSPQHIQQLYQEGLNNLNTTQTNTSTIVSQETRVGDTWSVAVTPSDGVLDAQTLLSNPLTIQSVNISTCEELQNMSNNLKQHYVLTNDINCSDTINWNSGEGYEPVGTPSNSFEGTLDGNGHIIYDVYINRPTGDYNGIIGVLNSSGKVYDLGVENVNITADYVGGAVVGRTYGNITRVYSTGSITGDNDQGGVVGWHSGGVIADSYSTASVTGANWVGGLSGSTSSNIVRRSYATGLVTGTGSEVGALIGNNNGPTYDSFWNSQTSGQNSSESGTGKTTSEMKTITTYNDTATPGLTEVWDIVAHSEFNQSSPSTWFIRENNYPELWFQYTENEAPTHDKPVLNSSLETNTTTENLTVYAQTLNDIDGDNISLNFDWRLNGTSIAVLNMPFNVNVSSNQTGAVRDYSSYENNATLGGGTTSQMPTWVPDGVVGGSYSFDGVDDYIQIPYDSSFDLAQKRSVFVWIKSIPDARYRGVLTQYADEAALLDGFDISINSENNLQVAVLEDGNAGPWKVFTTSGINITDGQWHHVGFTFEENQLIVYANGNVATVNVLHNNTVTSIHNSTQDILVGALNSLSGATSFYQGHIDEVQLYNITLRTQQIQQIYQEGLNNLNNNQTNTSTILSQETTVDDNWSVAVTPSDGKVDGQTKISNALIVLNEDIYTNNSFVTTWDTTLGTPNNTVALPLESDGNYNFTVDWGDDSQDAITIWNQAETNHTYSSPGIYNITIEGTLDGWRFNNAGDRLKIIDVSQWGDMSLGNNSGYFYGASNMDISATDAPNLTQTITFDDGFRNTALTTPNMSEWDTGTITSMSRTFRDAETFNADISLWDVSQVTDMDMMFWNAELFNQPIGAWNTSNLENIWWMFSNAENFNQDLSNWEISKIPGFTAFLRRAYAYDQPINWDTSTSTYFEEFFYSATSFNQDISDWNMSGVTNIQQMFRDAESFNQDISNWDTSNIQFFGRTFMDASIFNQPIGAWNTSSAQTMWRMFYNADTFDQDISNWKIHNVTNMTDFFGAGSGLSAKNTDKALQEWSKQNLQNNVQLHLGSSVYTVMGNLSRQEIIDNYNWNITGGTLSPLPVDYSFDGDSTNFSAVGDLNSTAVTLENSTRGKISWDNVNASYQYYDRDILFGNSWVFVNASNLHSSHNSSANITLEGSFTNPVVYRDGVVCSNATSPACELLNLSASSVTFSVESFSNYSVQSNVTQEDDDSSTGGGIARVFGSDPLLPTQARHSFTLLGPGVERWDVNKEAISFESLIFSLDSRVGSIRFWIEVLDNNPVEQTLPGEVHQYLHLETQVQDIQLTDTVQILFSTPQTNNENNTHLYRYENATWKQLPTTYLETRNNKHYFEAQSPGFSYYAIIQEQEQTSPEIIQPEPEVEQPPQPEEETDPEQPPQPEEKTSFSTISILVAVLAVVLAASTIWYAKTRKKE